MNKLAKIKKWCKQKNPLAGQGYIWVSGSNYPFEPDCICGRSLIYRNSHNYAIKLSEIESFDSDRTMVDNVDCLSRFEFQICNLLIDKFINETGLVKFNDAVPSCAFGSNIQFYAIDTPYGVSLLIWVTWDPSTTYAGRIYFPVEGMSDQDAKGLLSVRFLLIHSELPVK